MRCFSTVPLFFSLVLLAACSESVKPPAPEPVVPVPPPVAAPVIPAATPVAAMPITGPTPEKLAAFVAETAKASGREPADIQAWLTQARYQQSVINAITRPAESKPWKDYRPIFITPTRIAQGRAFFAEHRDELLKVQAETGVPAEIIIAIIGVETSYGRVTGNYRVLDALYTLGFYYPRREEFFRSELSQLFTLAAEEKFDVGSLKGSYAGAMGWGQFMPSSYRGYAKDGDGDGRRDLFTSLPDVFASVANYFVGYGWQAGQPVFVEARADPGAAPFVPDDYSAKYSLADLAARGYRPVDASAPDLPATLLTLDGAAGPEVWIGYPNFYVLTRYNRSPLYAMAVFQLAREIAAPTAAP
jgi:membrane-bound lytic murein transglycosylase B